MSARAYPASKRVESSFLTVVMAAIFALSLVPTGAWAAPVTGDIEVGVPVVDAEASALNKGTITLENTKKNETYEVYRIFDLASFGDEDVATGHHLKDKEAYSYVINDETVKYSDLTRSGSTNPWLTFLLNYGPNGIVKDGNDDANITTADYTADNFPYAMYSDDFETYKSSSEANATIAAKVYFVIESGTVTLNLPNPGYSASATGDGNATKKSLPVPGYHVVRANEDGPFAQKDRNDDADSKASVDYMGGNTERDDEDGNPAGQDFTAITNKVVQDFAQEALKYATNNHGATHTIDPNYVETGVGPTAADDTTVPVTPSDPGRVIVNEAITGQAGTSGRGTDYDGTGAVPLGWYLVGTSMGTLVSLDTTNKDVKVYEKNDEPTIEKAVMKKASEIPNTRNADTGAMSTQALYDYLTQPNSGMWVEDTAADVNDDVMFRTVVTAQQGAKDYVLHDAMERGLTLLTGDKSSSTHEYLGDAYVDSYDPQVFVVRRTEVTPATNPASYKYEVWYVPAIGKNTNESNAENYVFTHSNTPTDGCDFEIAFKDAVPEQQGKDDLVTFRAVSVMNANNTARQDYTTSSILVAGANYTDVDLKDGDQIVVLYWAEVNAKAAIWDGEQSLTGTEDDGYLAGESKENAKTSVKVNKDDSTVTADDIAEQKQQYANGNGRNDNYTILTYGAKSHTKWDEASVTTYGFDLTKTKEAQKDGVAADEYPLLAGAQFSVRKAIDSTEYGAIVQAAKDAKLEVLKQTNPSITELTAEQATEVENEVKDRYEEVKVQADNGYNSYYYLKADGKLAFTEVTGDTDFAKEPNALALTDPTDYVSTHRFYRYSGDGKTATTTVIEPTGEKSAHLYGLDCGVYVLTEEKAPTGYNKLAHPIVVTVTGDADNDAYAGNNNPVDGRYDSNDAKEGKIAVAYWTNDNVYKGSSEGYNKTDAGWKSTIQTSDVNENNTVVYDTDLNDDTATPHTKAANGGVQVINQTGAELPSTGGIGTTIFYVAGTVLVVGAAVMLVAKRRMGSEA